MKNNMKKHREKINLTQEELGKKLGISQETISQYESGTRTPNVFMAIKIAKALKTKLEAIFMP